MASREITRKDQGAIFGTREVILLSFYGFTQRHTTKHPENGKAV